jgi:hypothetical protein
LWIETNKKEFSSPNSQSLPEMTKVTTFEYDEDMIESKQEENKNLFEDGTFLFVNEGRQRQLGHQGDHIGFANTQFLQERFDD